MTRTEAAGVPRARATRRAFAQDVAAGLWLAAAGHTSAAPGPWRVVVVNGIETAAPAAVLHDRGLRAVLEAEAPNGVQFYVDTLDAMRFRGGELAADFLALTRRKYADQPVDLVIAVTEFAIDFVERNQTVLWPGVPVLAVAVEARRLAERGLPPQFARLPMSFGIEDTLTLVSALQPTAARLVVVGGDTAFDRVLSARIAAAARGRPGRAVDVWEGLTIDALRERLAALAPGDVVIHGSTYRDSSGRSWAPIEATRAIAAASPAPVYVLFATHLGTGALGGAMVDFEANGRRAGELAAAILSGRTPAAGATLAPVEPVCRVEAPRLAAFGLPGARLPEGCTLIDSPPSLWREHRGAVLVASGVLAIQALSIGALLWQRRRRRVAEAQARARTIELARAMRFATIGELTASIAHEITQPLGAILGNADAADMLLARGGTTTEELRAILADIRREDLRASEVIRRLRALLEKHEVEHAEFALHPALDEALGLLADEALRRGVTVERDLGAANDRLYGDRVQLQQVLLNLSLNAMDAMADIAAPQRRLVVTTAAAQGGDAIELRVADRGHGIEAAQREAVFESFYTTKAKGMGLGLPIVRAIAEAHEGTVAAAAREGGGTVFTVTLPRRLGARAAQAPAHAPLQPQAQP